MKKVAILLLVATALVFAKNPATKSQKKESHKTAEQVQPAAEEVAPAASQESAEEAVESQDAALDSVITEEWSYKDSTYTIYLHPMNFIVPYSHFWAGVNVPNGFTDYPLFNLSFEWKLIEKISLMSMVHYVSVDRMDDGYKVRDIGLQESFRLYGVGGRRWRFFQAGLLLSHLHIDTNDAGDFDGWLFGAMFNAGVKKVFNKGEGFWGRFVLSVDVGAGYVWVSGFDATCKGAWFEMEKDFVIDMNVAIGFQI